MKRLLVMLLFVATCAHAEIYTWTDKKGTSHYTNSIYEIPERYRAKAKVLDLRIVEKNEGASAQQDTTSQSNAPVQQNQLVQPVRPMPQPEVNPAWGHPERGYQGRRSRPSVE